MSTTLPFRLIPDRQGRRIIEYDFTQSIPGPGGYEDRSMPMRMQETLRPGPQIIKLLEMYADLEKQLDAVTKERDSAIARAIGAEAELNKRRPKRE